jgi:hypothetical protein
MYITILGWTGSITHFPHLMKMSSNAHIFASNFKCKLCFYLTVYSSSLSFTYQAGTASCCRDYSVTVASNSKPYYITTLLYTLRGHDIRQTWRSSAGSSLDEYRRVWDCSQFCSSPSTSSRQGSWCHCCYWLDSNRPRQTNGVSGRSSSWVTSVTPPPLLLLVLTRLIICKGNSVWTVFWELGAECWLRSDLDGIHVCLHVFQYVPPFFEVSYSYQ